MTTRYDPAAINAATDLASLVGRYVPLKRMGGEFVGRCVWHAPDENPSMYVIPGKGFVHCFACGQHADAIGFMQQVEGIDFKEACARLTNGSGTATATTPLPKRELKKAPERKTFPPPVGMAPPDMRLGTLGAPVKTWTYRTPEGDPIGYVARYEGEGGKKEIRCWSWGTRGTGDPERWECAHFSKPRPLYGLQNLVAEKQVLIVEGEKACDAAQALLPNLCAVTWPGGAMAVRHADFSPLAGRSVVIWPDADDAGKMATEHLVSALRKAGAARIKVLAVGTITVNGVETAAPDGWDAADAKASAWTREETWAWAKVRVGPDLVAVPQKPEPIPEPVQPEPLPPEAAPDAPESPVTSAPQSDSPEPPPDNVVPMGRRKPPVATPRPASHGGSGTGNALPAADPDYDVLPPANSQDALARELVDKVGDDWKYTAPRNQWYEWTGAIWKPEHTKGIFEQARAVCCAASNNPEIPASMRRELASRSTAASVVVMAEWDRRIAVEMDAWDTDKWLMGTPSGALDLRTGKLIDASREQLITMSTSVAPEQGTPEVWLRCLNEWTGGDQSLIDYLQRLCGYMLTGETREQMLAFFHGPAKAGKTTIIKHIAAIMGDYACNAEMETFIDSKQERHSSELARLRGKRMVYAAETEEGRRWAEARIKKLSGEDRITARNLYQNPEEFSPQFKLCIYGNHAPHLKNPDESISRRMHIIPFTHPVTDEQRDLRLDEKITPEHGKILWWMVQGCMAWVDCGGLGMPEAISNAVSTYMDAEDTFGDWINECVERRADAREKSADLYRSYRSFIEARGESPVSQKRFSPKLEERGFRRMKSMGMRMFEGGKLRAAPAADSQQSRPLYDDNDD